MSWSAIDLRLCEEYIRLIMLRFLGKIFRYRLLTINLKNWSLMNNCVYLTM
jgi:hypothetical protein